MDLQEVATAGPLITAGAALIVGGVTWVTQRTVARERVKWEGRLEVAKLDVARFEAALGHLVEAADAANRYVFSLGDIDATDYEERKPYVFPLLDALGRARAEIQALPEFEGAEQAAKMIKMLEVLVAVPESNEALLDLWDPIGLGEVINALSRARGRHMREQLSHRPSKGRASGRRERQIQGGL
ncbi:hypothetical protein [Streptomyces evansiae]|uniref:hypothetical protein n=1 Tax=Streptomyces evansiae TaxID=3075535 RepID=UPI0028878CC0|nr:hypothetical protein [Streptomyces sp. DSM 41859]MDT0422946.1 hypothetical protein [Streptomyces sp. DSM 41859]